MHNYLRAVGFSGFRNRNELQKVLEEIIQAPDQRYVVREKDSHVFAEMTKWYGRHFGVSVCGEYDENHVFQMEYYVPVFKGSGISTSEEVTVEQRMEKESFSGACDDVRMGVTLIFYLNNAGEYLNHLKKEKLGKTSQSLTLSALSTEGRILLPICREFDQIERDRQTMRRRTQMLGEAMDGDEEAMENLTMEDMDTYAMITRRVACEDILSIVDTSFMPYGMECDHYSIIGEITELVWEQNTRTGEEVCQMTVLCNDMEIDVCINRKDLEGEPQVGRRFKGSIWLQGHLNF